MKIERKWLMNRLKAMSVIEIVHRCRRLASYFYDLAIFRMGWMGPTRVRVAISEHTLFDSVAIQPACDVEKATLNDDNNSKVADKHRMLWLNNTVQLFDAHSKYSLGTPVQWLTDPKTGVKTPRKFGRSIDYRDDKCVGEIKYLWEVARHQFLVPMAVRVAFEHDDAVRDRLSSHLSSWLVQNPVGMGIHWCSSLEVGLRLVSWSLIHALLQSGGERQGIFALDVDADLLRLHIHAQVKFITGNYSRYSSSNNHLIGELTSVWVACNVFDLGSRGTEWREAAFAELENECMLQTHEDGVNKEQAIYYHLWSLEYFWLAWSVAKRFQRPVSEAYEERMVGMYLFLQAMCSSTHMPSQIGDADGGVVCRFNPDIGESVFHALLEPLTQVLEGRITQKSGSAHLSSEVQSIEALNSKRFWYEQLVAHADSSTVQAIYQQRRTKLGVSDAFESGGYYVLRGQQCHMVFRAGPFGYLATAAHSHADALSVTLAIEKHWWLVDPGTYTYHSSGEWRNYFRSTAAHNTLCVNQTDQSEIAGDFLWSRKTDAHVYCVERKSVVSGSAAQVLSGHLSTVSGSHSGYAEQGVKHERTVQCDGANAFEIHDQVTLDAGVTECSVQLAFHLHPEVILQQLDTHRWLATRQNSSQVLTIDLPAQFDWSLAKGRLEPIAGWYSETYGVKTPTNSLLGRAVLNQTDGSETKHYRTLLLVHNDVGMNAGDGVAP